MKWHPPRCVSLVFPVLNPSSLVLLITLLKIYESQSNNNKSLGNEKLKVRNADEFGQRRRRCFAHPRQRSGPIWQRSVILTCRPMAVSQRPYQPGPPARRDGGPTMDRVSGGTVACPPTFQESHSLTTMPQPALRFQIAQRPAEIWGVSRDGTVHRLLHWHPETKRIKSARGCTIAKRPIIPSKLFGTECQHREHVSCVSVCWDRHRGGK